MTLQEIELYAHAYLMGDIREDEKPFFAAVEDLARRAQDTKEPLGTQQAQS